MATWTAYTPTNTTIGRFRSLGSMVERVAPRMAIGDIFLASTGTGKIAKYQVTKKGAIKLPNADKRLSQPTPRSAPRSPSRPPAKQLSLQY